MATFPNAGDLDFDAARKANPDLTNDQILHRMLAPYLDPAYGKVPTYYEPFQPLDHGPLQELPKEVLMSDNERRFGQTDEDHFKLIKDHERNMTVENALSTLKIIAPTEIFPGQEQESNRNACKNYVSNLYSEMFSESLQFENIARLAPFLEKHKYVPRTSLNKADSIYSNLRDKYSRYD